MADYRISNPFQIQPQLLITTRPTTTRRTYADFQHDYHPTGPLQLVEQQPIAKKRAQESITLWDNHHSISTQKLMKITRLSDVQTLGSAGSSDVVYELRGKISECATIDLGEMGLLCTIKLKDSWFTHVAPNLNQTYRVYGTPMPNGKIRAIAIKK